MSANYLPEGFEKLQSESRYVNLGKLPEGEYRFRILSRPIAGWIDWRDKKPMRFKPEAKPKAPVDPEKPIKSFWAMVVWDYSRSALAIMEVTQNSIRKALETLALNEDWGDLTGFDFTLKKEGSALDTTYTVVPIPPKPLAQVIKDALTANPVRLEALYEGADPWNDVSNVHTLDDKQCAKIDSLLSTIGEPDFKKVLEKHFKVNSIYDVTPDQEFERVILALEQKIKSKTKEKAHGPSNLATVA